MELHGDQIKRLETIIAKAETRASQGGYRNSESDVVDFGNPAEHLKLVAPLIPKATYAKPSSDKSVYQGELRGTLGNVLEAVSKTMKLQFTPWPLPDAVAKREIKITYNRATMDDVLTEIGKAGRLQFQRSGTNAPSLFLSNRKQRGIKPCNQKPRLSKTTFRNLILIDKSLSRQFENHSQKYRPAFQEQMQYGMIGYSVPHSIYPPGYHCDPKQPLPLLPWHRKRTTCRCI